MEKKKLKAEWERYRQLIPADAGEVQVRETRMAFYAGAAVMVKLITDGVDHGAEVTASDLAHVGGLHHELEEFAAELDKGVRQ